MIFVHIGDAKRAVQRRPVTVARVLSNARNDQGRAAGQPVAGRGDHARIGSAQSLDGCRIEIVPRFAVYINSDGKVAKADADAAATMPVITLVKDAAISQDAEGECYQIGDEITNAGWSWTPGALVFAGTTAGALTQTAPSGSGDQVQVIGIATAATKMVLWPQLVTIEVA